MTYVFRATQNLVPIPKYNGFVNLRQLHRIILEECKLQIDRPILVGVSGGPDSLCLLDVLDRLNYSLIIAHFDHSLRPTSGKEAQIVEKISAVKNIPFVHGKMDVLKFASEENLSIEEAARIARYRFLFAQAKKNRAQAIAVGHTADDQVETILMHLLRGTGLTGLTGMAYRNYLKKWDTEIPVVRPLLGIWKEEIISYCFEQNIESIFDESNQDVKFLRNRLRHELIPYLEEFNPKIKPAIWRMSQSLQGDYGIIEVETEEAWTRCLIEKSPNHVELSTKELRRMPAGLQRNILRKAIACLRPQMDDVDFSVIESTMAFLKEPGRSSQAHLAQKLRVFIEGDRFFIAEQGIPVLDEVWPQMDKDDMVLTIPGKLLIGDSWLLECGSVSVEPNYDFSTHTRAGYQMLLDADMLRDHLIARIRRPGDRFRPFGMKGHSVKLSDFFINEKLPQRARDRWPLILNGDQIIWIPGYRSAHSVRITDETQSVLILRLVRV